VKNFKNFSKKSIFLEKNNFFLQKTFKPGPHLALIHPCTI